MCHKICDRCQTEFNISKQGYYYKENLDFEQYRYAKNFSEETRKKVAGKYFCCAKCEFEFMFLLGR